MTDQVPRVAKPQSCYAHGMSMKRSKSMNYGRRQGGDDSPSWATAGKKDPEKAWSEWMEGHADGEFTPYALTARFEKGALLAHSTFGRGIVTDVDGRRIDVLFEAGKKKLSHAGA